MKTTTIAGNIKINIDCNNYSLSVSLMFWPIESSWKAKAFVRVLELSALPQTEHIHSINFNVNLLASIVITFARQKKFKGNFFPEGKFKWHWRALATAITNSLTYHC